MKHWPKPLVGITLFAIAVVALPFVPRPLAASPPQLQKTASYPLDPTCPPPCEPHSYLETTQGDWMLGQHSTVDVRNLDALGTPYAYDDDSRGSVRLQSQPGTWSKYADNPVLVPGAAGAWDNYAVGHPGIVQINGTYHLWYTGVQSSGTGTRRIGYATSPDGLIWTKYANNPVLDLGSAGAWDDSWVAQPHILYDGIQYQLWFRGVHQADGKSRIGYATSSDGLNWTKYADNPVLQPGDPGSWDDYDNSGPRVIFDGQGDDLWYTGGQDNKDSSVGYATSPDGITWTKHAGNPVLEPSPAGAWDEAAARDAAVIFDGTTFKLWYSGRDRSNHYRIGYATSPDGVHWTKSPDNPVLDLGPTGAWDDYWVLNSNVIFDGSKYEMWYHARRDGQGRRLGYADAPPIYAPTGTYTTPLVESGADDTHRVVWQSLRVDQQLNGQAISYDLLDAEGNPIPGFSGLSAPDGGGSIDLSGLPDTYTALHLRANLSSSDPALSPVLEEWELNWCLEESTPPPPPVCSWQMETVDSTGDVGPYTSLALDGDNGLHISYYDQGSGDLKYAYDDGGSWGWVLQTVDSTGDVGQWTALALDSTGLPHIKYLNYANLDLKYAYHDGSTWHTETVDGAGRVGRWGATLALDPSDHPYISYYDGTNGNLKYAFNDGSGWQIEVIDSAGVVGGYSSLTLDGAGHPHISYYDWTDSALNYAYYDGTWQIEMVDSTGDVGRHTSLVLDAAGLPHISYIDSGNMDLKYARYDGTNWHIETVDSAGDVGRHTSLVLDAAGLPHISYYDVGEGNLKYTHHDGTAWQVETVDSDGDVGAYTGLILDAAGLPHISYYDATNGDLKHAWLVCNPFPPTSLEIEITIEHVVPGGSEATVVGSIYAQNDVKNTAYINGVRYGLEYQPRNEIFPDPEGQWIPLMEGEVAGPGQIEPGGTTTWPYQVTFPVVPEARVYRIVGYVELQNHSGGPKIFLDRESFTLSDIAKEESHIYLPLARK